MKKNEKGFAQNEKDLENVAGGLGGVSTKVSTGNITLFTKTEINDSTNTENKSQNLAFGNVHSLEGANFSVN